MSACRLCLYEAEHPRHRHQLWRATSPAAVMRHGGPLVATAELRRHVCAHAESPSPRRLKLAAPALHPIVDLIRRVGPITEGLAISLLKPDADPVERIYDLCDARQLSLVRVPADRLAGSASVRLLCAHDDQQSRREAHAAAARIIRQEPLYRALAAAAELSLTQQWRVPAPDDELFDAVFATTPMIRLAIVDHRSTPQDRARRILQELARPATAAELLCVVCVDDRQRDGYVAHAQELADQPSNRRLLITDRPSLLAQPAAAIWTDCALGRPTTLRAVL